MTQPPPPAGQQGAPPVIIPVIQAPPVIPANQPVPTTLYELPVPRSQKAPYFEGEPERYEDFVDEVDKIIDKYNAQRATLGAQIPIPYPQHQRPLAEGDKIKAFVKYCSPEVRKVLQGTEQYGIAALNAAGNASYNAFKDEVEILYNISSTTRKYTKQRLDDLVDALSGMPPVKDLATYFARERQYQAMAGWLKSMGKITEQDYDEKFWKSFPYATRMNLRRNMKLYNPHVRDDIPYRAISVRNIAEILWNPNRFDAYDDPEHDQHDQAFVPARKARQDDDSDDEGPYKRRGNRYDRYLVDPVEAVAREATTDRPRAVFVRDPQMEENLRQAREVEARYQREKEAARKAAAQQEQPRVIPVMMEGVQYTAPARLPQYQPMEIDHARMTQQAADLRGSDPASIEYMGKYYVFINQYPEMRMAVPSPVYKEANQYQQPPPQQYQATPQHPFPGANRAAAYQRRTDNNPNFAPMPFNRYDRQRPQLYPVNVVGNRECFFCGQQGHMSNQCPEFRRLETSGWIERRQDQDQRWKYAFRNGDFVERRGQEPFVDAVNREMDLRQARERREAAAPEEKRPPVVQFQMPVEERQPVREAYPFDIAGPVYARVPEVHVRDNVTRGRAVPIVEIPETRAGQRPISIAPLFHPEDDAMIIEDNTEPIGSKDKGRNVHRIKRQSEVKAGFDLERTFAKLMEVQVPLSLKEALGISDGLSKRLGESMRSRNIANEPEIESNAYVWNGDLGMPLIKCEILIGTEKFVALIDGGSQISLVAKSSAGKVHHAIQDVSVEMQGIAGRSKVNGRMEGVEIHIGGEKTKISLWIGEESSSFDILLGRDWRYSNRISEVEEMDGTTWLVFGGRGTRLEVFNPSRDLLPDDKLRPRIVSGQVVECRVLFHHGQGLPVSNTVAIAVGAVILYHCLGFLALVTLIVGAVVSFAVQGTDAPGAPVQQPNIELSGPMTVAVRPEQITIPAQQVEMHSQRTNVNLRNTQFNVEVNLDAQDLARRLRERDEEPRLITIEQISEITRLNELATRQANETYDRYADDSTHLRALNDWYETNARDTRGAVALNRELEGARENIRRDIEEVIRETRVRRQQYDELREGLREIWERIGGMTGDIGPAMITLRELKKGSRSIYKQVTRILGQGREAATSIQTVGGVIEGVPYVQRAPTPPHPARIDDSDQGSPRPPSYRRTRPNTVNSVRSAHTMEERIFGEEPESRQASPFLPADPITRATSRQAVDGHERVREHSVSPPPRQNNDAVNRAHGLAMIGRLGPDRVIDINWLQGEEAVRARVELAEALENGVSEGMMNLEGELMRQVSRLHPDGLPLEDFFTGEIRNPALEVLAYWATTLDLYARESPGPTQQLEVMRESQLGLGTIEAFGEFVAGVDQRSGGLVTRLRQGVTSPLLNQMEEGLAEDENREASGSGTSRVPSGWWD